MFACPSYLLFLWDSYWLHELFPCSRIWASCSAVSSQFPTLHQSRLASFYDTLLHVTHTYTVLFPASNHSWALFLKPCILHGHLADCRTQQCAFLPTHPLFKCIISFHNCGNSCLCKKWRMFFKGFKFASLICEKQKLDIRWIVWKILFC